MESAPLTNSQEQELLARIFSHSLHSSLNKSRHQITHLVRDQISSRVICLYRRRTSRQATSLDKHQAYQQAIYSDKVRRSIQRSLLRISLGTYNNRIPNRRATLSHKVRLFSRNLRSPKQHPIYSATWVRHNLQATFLAKHGRLKSSSLHILQVHQINQ